MLALKDLQDYINDINTLYNTGIATEHSYRPALRNLLIKVLSGLTIINEPSRTECGAPDFIISPNNSNVPIAFIETKNIDDNDLDGQKGNREQFDRYKQALDRIVFTDYLDFHFYENDKCVDTVRIGKTKGDKIIANENSFEKFVSLLNYFTKSKPQKIASAKKLSRLMASKAKLLAVAISSILQNDKNKDSYTGNQITGLYAAFKTVLLHDLDEERFADIYAQTIVYGMFAARMHDKHPSEFNRQRAAELIPKTNPFLRQIFQSIAGYDLDERIVWVVDDVAFAFANTDFPKIMHGYGANTRHSDPMIHFYEEFLAVYNPKLRKQMGVWYTPSPVVNFIVKSVDEILQKVFNLPKGLADYSIIYHPIINESYIPQQKGKKKKIKETINQPIHRVQILDPAVGTGTFLSQIINTIYDKFENSHGMWESYVAEHLIPRLNGFEIMMAPYSIAHLKLDWLLSKTGYEHTNDKRFRIYLTNSLEEYDSEVDNVLSSWLTKEAREASHIKRDTPVMVMIGNPPYNGSSKNKGEWIMKLMESYKKEPGEETRLNERNSKWLNDDYVKFIRMSQYFIEKNGTGIIAFVNPHGFLDNPTFRGMRYELLQTFDSIYTLDLHGNVKREEKSPDGSQDDNVFDIEQGISINFFIKTGKKENGMLGKVFHADLYGVRKHKYDFLNRNSWDSVAYTELSPKHPKYNFVPQNNKLKSEYNKGFSVKDLFQINSVGIVTTKDKFLICDSPSEVEARISDLINLTGFELSTKYGLKDTRDWSISRAKEDVGKRLDTKKIQRINYRWADDKFLYYTGLTNGIVARPRYRSLSHMLHPRNFALITVRQIAGKKWSHVSICDTIAESCKLSNKTKEIGYIFPLYQSVLAEGESNFSENTKLVPNINIEILNRIKEETNLPNLNHEDLFDYVYGILHSTEYREKYNEFLKEDFPVIPYPERADVFTYYQGFGTKLRLLHLMNDSSSWEVSSTFPEIGNNKVEAIYFKDKKVFINETQYFGNIEKQVWDLVVGGYQPALKWLKDRKGKILNFDDIRHYQEILYSLSKTIEYIEQMK